MAVLSVIFYSLLVTFTIIYGFFKYRYTFWKRLGVPYVEPSIPFGSIKLKHATHLAMEQNKIYQKMKGCGPFVGLFLYFKPTVLILDLDLVKNILIKDFHYFQDRNIFHNKKDDPLSANVFTLQGEEWKNLRTKLTPTFTLGKIRFMFETIKTVSDEFQKAIKLQATRSNEIEIKEFCSRFAVDVIGTCAFGIDCNSLKNSNSEFYQMARKAMSTKNTSSRLLIATFKPIARFLKLKANETFIIDFFKNIVKNTIAYREASNIKRNDLMGSFIKLMNTGKLDGENVGRISLNEILSQTYAFFFAGYVTSSACLSFCLYELALNQDIQNKARQTINEALSKYNGEFTYECMMEMTYLDQIINESLRKHPPASIMRRATYDYKVPNTNLIIPKGTNVWISAYAIHHDPEYHPNPQIFDPERFSADNMKTRPLVSFLPFGHGPRNCIAQRFAFMEVKNGLVALLTKCKLTPCAKTTTRLEYSKDIILSAKGGLWLHVENL